MSEDVFEDALEELPPPEEESEEAALETAELAEEATETDKDLSLSVEDGDEMSEDIKASSRRSKPKSLSGLFSRLPSLTKKKGKGGGGGGSKENTRWEVRDRA